MTEKQRRFLEAWENGQDVQYLSKDGTWSDLGAEITLLCQDNSIGIINFEFLREDAEFRIKPEMNINYPIFCKCQTTGAIVQFESLQSGRVVEQGSSEVLPGTFGDSWFPHTASTAWREMHK